MRVGMVVSAARAFATLACAALLLPALASAQGVCPQISRALSVGSRGDDVSALQSFLSQSGLYPEGLVTGYFGPLTLAALERWQAQEGIVSSGSPGTTGWGLAGPRTRQALAQCGGGNPSPGNEEPPSSCAPIALNTSPVPYLRVEQAADFVVASADNPYSTRLQTTPLPPGLTITSRQSVDSLGKPEYEWVLSGAPTEAGVTTVNVNGSNDCSYGTLQLVISVLSDSALQPPRSTLSACPAAPVPPTCSGSSPVASYDGAGCVVAYVCNSSSPVSTTPPAVSGTLKATPSSGQAPLAVSFSTPITAENDVGALFVSFGDGTSGTMQKHQILAPCFGTVCPPAGSWDVSHTYSTPGTYTAQLRTPGSDNCPAGSVCIQSLSQLLGTAVITIGSGGSSGAPSVGGVNGPASLQVGQTGTWKVNASVPNQPGAQLNYSVFWGDELGALSAASAPSSLQTSATFTHSYAQAGTYQPTFTVSNAAGSASASASIVVSSGGTQTNLLTATPSSGQAPLAVSFTTGSVSNGFGAPKIDFGDGQIVTPSPQACTQSIPGSCTYAASHTYSTSGTYTAQLLQGFGGCTSDVCAASAAQILGTVTVTVGSGGTQTASLTASPTSGTAPLSVAFSGSAPGTNYSLDFGDGSAPTLRQETIDCPLGVTACGVGAFIPVSATHTYSAPGTYVARLAYSQPCPAGAVCAQNISIAAPSTVTITVINPQAPSLAASPLAGVAPLTVNFTAIGLTNQYFYRIGFGDGQTSDALIPSTASLSHTYSSAGIYTAILMRAPNQCYGSLFPCTQLTPTNWSSVSALTISVTPREAVGAAAFAAPGMLEWLGSFFGQLLR